MSQQQEHVLRDNSDATYTNDRKHRGIIGDGVTPIIVYNDIETDALSQVAVRSNDCIVLQKTTGRAVHRNDKTALRYTAIAMFRMTVYHALSNLPLAHL